MNDEEKEESGAEKPAVGFSAVRRSIFVLCAALGLMFAFATMGSALSLVATLKAMRSAPSHPGEKSAPARGTVSTIVRQKDGSDLELRQSQTMPMTPEPGRIAIGLFVASVGTVLGLGGFVLRRRRAGIHLQRLFGAMLLANLLLLPFSLAEPIIWPAVLLLCVAGVGLWILLVTIHPAERKV